MKPQESKVRTDMPHRVVVHENVWIPLRDGVRLAAKMWLPEDATPDEPVPAIVEYIPYRKNDAEAIGDAEIHGYFAGHGYAAVRVDMRGTGDSDGIHRDEYTVEEQLDGIDVLRWLAGQEWCSGKVGMIGLSWGGFIALQIAARAPEELGAVIVVGFSDDRYSDDVHYWGGTMFARFAPTWAAHMLAYDARPPDPDVSGPAWRQKWLERLQNAEPFIGPWLDHQRYDDYWKQGSVSQDYAAVKCPVYAVGGWNDAYTDPVLRVVEHLRTPVKGLIGPWGHMYPHDGVPGPAIGFLTEAVRWWDHWLKGVDNGIMDEPKLRLYSQDAVPPAASYDTRPGRWVAEPAWPSPNVQTQRFQLGQRSLHETSVEITLTHSSPLTPATDGGNWAGWGHDGDFAADQRPEDGQALTFDSVVLDQPLEILGRPALQLRVAVDQPLGIVCARLCDVAPNGASTLITRGILNLTHRDSRERPTPLEPGHRYDVSIHLKAISYNLPPGHILRLALSTSYWPWSWPPPETTTLTIETVASSLDIPVRVGARADDIPPGHFARPEAAPGLTHEVLAPPRMGRTIHQDVGSGTMTITDLPTFLPSVRLLDRDGLTYAEDGRDTFTIQEGNPLSASVTSHRAMELSRDEWHTRVQVESTTTSTTDEFCVTSTLEAFENRRRIFARTWTQTFERDHL